MLNEIIKGVSMSLNKEFGDGYKVYMNNVEQGLEEPCFFIDVLKPELSPLQMRRYKKTNPFDVLYFPTEETDNATMYGVAERMMNCLEFISLPNGDQLHGTNMSYEIVDGVLHFFVNYNCTLYKPHETPIMETLDVDVFPE